MQYTTSSIEETHQIAETFCQQLNGGEVVALHGELGAGKTTFVQGIAKALGVSNPITSPTFTIMNVYEASHPTIKLLIHIDCYRISGADDLRAIGADEYFGREDVVVFIEWPERVTSMLPRQLPGIRLQLGKMSNQRIINITL